jgi:hypothetical protein
MVDPARWLQTLDGQRYARKVRSNGTVSVDEVSYYIGSGLAGQYVTLQVDAAARAFVVEAGERVVTCLPIKGLGQAPLPYADYLAQMRSEARTAGGPAPHGPTQLPLPLS